jgi:DtxR family transcriptional regulator, Mn-dependent transcriptional regulator
VAPLSEVTAGEQYEIASIRQHNRSRMARLATYGVIPGSRVHLLQKRPAYVIRIGETDLALDIDVARDIMVHEPGSSQRSN